MQLHGHSHFRKPKQTRTELERSLLSFIQNGMQQGRNPSGIKMTSGVSPQTRILRLNRIPKKVAPLLSMLVGDLMHQRMNGRFSHELVTTIQNATVETVQAITAKNTWNNIDYDSTMWQTAMNVPVEVEARREMH